MSNIEGTSLDQAWFSFKAYFRETFPDKRISSRREFANYFRTNLVKLKIPNKKDTWALKMQDFEDDDNLNEDVSTLENGDFDAEM